jgi:hypothetical protein
VHNSHYFLFIAFALIFFTKKSFGQSLVPNTKKIFVLHTDSLPLRPGATFTLKKDDYVTNLAFFCRQEWKLEKALRVPLRFRVGSLEHCNLLEGKK